MLLPVLLFLSVLPRFELSPETCDREGRVGKSDLSIGKNGVWRDCRAGCDQRSTRALLEERERWIRVDHHRLVDWEDRIEIIVLDGWRNWSENRRRIGGLTLTCSESKLTSLVISLEGIVESRFPDVVSSSGCKVGIVAGMLVGGSTKGVE